MGTPNLTGDQIAWVVAGVSAYIVERRNAYGNRVAPLTEDQRASVGEFFSAEVLQTNVVVLRGERIPNPPFYPQLIAMGLTNLPDQSDMAAVTFDTIVASHVPFYPGLLFHELVHIEQYRQLGLARFSEPYVNGFLNAGGYRQIPLEDHAYQLQERFEANPARVFSVEESVRQRIRNNTF